MLNAVISLKADSNGSKCNLNNLIDKIFGRKSRCHYAIHIYGKHMFRLQGNFFLFQRRAEASKT